jgi:hypothetical protein
VGEYATEDPVSLRKRRQRRRALITIGTVLLGLFFAFWYALSYYETDSRAGASGSPPPTCVTPNPKQLRPEQVKLQVLNATSRNGLAASTGTALAGRGFVVSGVGNDPGRRKAPAVAELRYGKGGEAGAKLVLTVMPKGTALYNDKRKAATVDVVLGAKFTSLLAPAAGATSGLPPCPTPSAS